LLVWNPFIRDPHYMLKLRQAVDAYKVREVTPACTSSSSNSPRVRRTILGSVSVSKDPANASSDTTSTVSSSANSSGTRIDDLSVSYYAALDKADAALDTWVLRYARTDPRGSIRTVGHILVLVGKKSPVTILTFC
jgi:hypothetical protein